MTANCGSSLFNTGPTAHWIGPEMLVDLIVEGKESKALANSGGQVNTITPTYVHQHEFPILPLADLVDHPLNLVGLGGGTAHKSSWLHHPPCADQGDHWV